MKVINVKRKIYLRMKVNINVTKKILMKVINVTKKILMKVINVTKKIYTNESYKRHEKNIWMKVINITKKYMNEIN